MGRIRGLLKRLEALVRSRAVEQRLDEEMEFHLARETEQNLAAGLTPDEARRKAILDFGGVQQTRELHREVRLGRWLEEVPGDVRHALRTLRRSPVFALTAILTLAIGIGANTAIFSVVSAVILQPLPFPHPEQLVMLSEDNAEKGWVQQSAAPANYLDWKDRVSAFQDAAAYTQGGGSTLSGTGEAQQIRVRSVTGNYFSVLGVKAELGTSLQDADTWRQGPGIAVISHQLWAGALHGDRAIVGRTITLDGQPVTVAGVMPATFSFAADSIDVWQAMGWKASDRSQTWFRRAHWIRVIARLKPGITPAVADAEFQSVVRQLQTEFPVTNRVMGADLVPLHDFLIGDLKTPLLLLLGAVALLLLIACANVANLLLAQAVGREREISLRLTLGARTGRIIRQALTESLVLALLGGAGGLWLGWWGTRALAALQPSGMLPVMSVPMDTRVLLWVFLLTTLTGLLFGIAPAVWNAARVPAEVLKDGGKGGSAGLRSRQWAGLLVIGEIALALVLTVGAGLLVRSYWQLESVDPGLDPRGVTAIGVRLSSAYDSSARQLQFFNAVRQRVSALPDVAVVGLGMVAPLGNTTFTSDFHIGGHPPDDYGSEVMRDYASPDYFRALGIPLRTGRFFNEADRTGSEMVVIINEALARKYFAGQNPVGQRITFDRIPDSASVWRTIVGVVGDVHQRGLALEPQITAYESFGQQTNGYMTLLVKSRNPDGAPVAAVRRILAEVDPTIGTAQVSTMEALVARSIARQRFIMALLLVFAMTGLILSVVGVYGVMAQLAARRTREMGIRMALGAQATQVRWLVLRHAVLLLSKGMGLGLLAALLTAYAMRTLLYQIPPADPVTFAVVPISLALTGILASWLPALRASRADPATTLRSE
jgi:putative ABC transport system permease protein